MLFILWYQNLKFLEHASDILKRRIVKDIKSKFTLRSSGILLLKKAIPRFIYCFEYLHSNHFFQYRLFPSAIFLSRCSVDQTFHYQNKSCCISKSNCRVYFSYSGKGEKMLSQETDECQLILYVRQFQVA